ncbi:peptidoglycan editing factor PgeF [Pradoshia sp.]
MESFVQTSESILSIIPWVEKFPNLAAGFTTKDGGVSKGHFSSMNPAFHVHDLADDVVRNRKIAAERIHVPAESWVGAEQTHETNIAKITAKQAGLGALDYASALKQTDGMYTRESGVLLTLLFADCVPVFFFAPKHHLVGAAHAGWKGTVGGISKAMVEKWTRVEGVPVEDIYAAIGPSICPKCYMVDKKIIDMLELILEEETKTAYNQITDTQFALDLKKANALILRKSGILNENIITSEFCTSCDESLFFSHRRDKGKTGRMMGFIGFKEE